jgi:hypothetical protein
MTDERYVFEQDVREKKRTARGYHNKVRQGGRIKLPSDYLTRKEKEMLNGEVSSYRMNAPITWDEFKSMPSDIRAEYLNGLIERYSAPCGWIAEMMGTSQKTLRIYAYEAGVGFKQQSGRAIKKLRPAWDAFLNGETIEETTTETSNETSEETSGETKAEIEPPKPKLEVKAEAHNIAALLQMLVGTGAKLTIEIQL